MINTVAPTLFDALYIPGGRKSIEYLSKQKEVLEFVCAIYSAGKNIAVDDEAIELLEQACLNRKLSSLSTHELNANGIFVHTNTIPVVKHFMKAIAADYAVTQSKENVHVN